MTYANGQAFAREIHPAFVYKRKTDIYIRMGARDTVFQR